MTQHTPAAASVQTSAPSPFRSRATYWPAFTTERVFRAPVERMWKMWTTKEGLDMWYWPEPFVARTKHLDLRPGGTYEIEAIGLPHTSRGTYTEVVPNKRLSAVVPIDFIPDVEAYDRVDTVEFHAMADGNTRMVFTSSRLHTDEFQGMSNAGWGSSMDKLERVLENGGPTYGGSTLERTFRASPEKVWAMWTTKEGLEKWFAPHPFVPTVEALDVRVGGRFAIRLKSPEHDIVNHGTYTTVQPAWELGWIWHFDIFLEPGTNPYDVPVFLNLERLADGGTKMRFTQGPLARPEFTEGSRQGFAANFEKMAQALGE